MRLQCAVIGLSSFHLQISQMRSYSDPNNNLEVLKNISSEVKEMPGVTDTFIERQGTVLAAGKNGRSGAAVRAVEPRLFQDSAAFSKYVTVVEGEAAFPKRNSAIIGKKIAETLGLNVGDTIRLSSEQSTNTGSVIPRVMN